MSEKTGVACEVGEYKDFTGIIMWGNNESVVENADFGLGGTPFFKFTSFYSGVWDNGYWYSGTWKDGTWEDGVWMDGTWEEGVDRLGKIVLKSPDLWKGRKIK